MSKTIKIIDLFLKIANNEELPRKIKFEGCIYKLIPTINYYCEETKIFWLDILYGASLNNSLNYEVEIIEEQEEIDIQSIKETDIEKDCNGSEYYTYLNKNNTETGYSVNYSLDDIETRKKINELI